MQAQAATGPLLPNDAVHCFANLKTGIKMHFIMKGQGPAVMFVHGWPETWYSWRHQVTILLSIQSSAP